MQKIKVTDLKFSYPDCKLFKGLNLDLEANANNLLIGANGSGKTTLLKILAGLISTSSVESTFQKNIPFYLGHSTQLYTSLSVEENIKFFSAFTDADVSEAIEYWNLNPFLKKEVKSLSKGQKQLAALAVSMLLKPNLLYLDEPSSNLDTWAFNQLIQYIDYLKDYHSGEVIVLVASHDLQRFQSWADKVFVLEDSNIESYETSKLEEVYLGISK